MAVLFKQLTATDCRYKLSVPTEFHDLINGCVGGAELSVRDADTNKMYEFVLAVRRPEDRYEKPVFQSAGWLDFVRNRHLQAGDGIFFSQDEKNAGGFKIQARYAVKGTEPLSKLLTTTDCNSAFSLPRDFHALINGGLPCGQQLSVRDGQTNQMYNFVLEVHPAEKNYLPVFQAKPWLEFVKRRGLDAGDEIYFSIDEPNAGRFKIQTYYDFWGRENRAFASTTH